MSDKNVYFMTLKPGLKSVWKANFWSEIPFIVDLSPSQGTEFVSSESVVTRISAYLELKKSDGTEIKNEEANNQENKSIIPCSSINYSENYSGALTFEFDSRGEYYFEEEILPENQSKLSFFFLNKIKDNPSLMVRICQSVFDSRVSSFAFILGVEFKSKLPVVIPEDSSDIVSSGRMMDRRALANVKTEEKEGVPDKVESSTVNAVKIICDTNSKETENSYKANSIKTTTSALSSINAGGVSSQNIKNTKNQEDGENATRLFEETMFKNVATTKDFEKMANDNTVMKKFLLHGRSFHVIAAEYSLSIEENFSHCLQVLRRGKTEIFDWFNKTGGENAGIDVIVHIRNSRGAIEENFPNTLAIKAELVYDDGTPAPTMPFAPLRERRSSGHSKNPLFRPLRPEPILGKGRGSQSFSFRIEEVSFHHPGHDGFKLKVSSKDNLTNILPGLMEETIVVRSKPKSDEDDTRRRKGGRTTFIINEETFESLNWEGLPKKRKRKVNLADLEYNLKIEDEEEDISITTFSMNNISKLFTGGISYCLYCKAELGSSSGLCPSDHKMDCRLAMTVAPFVTIVNASSVPKLSSVKQEHDDLRAQGIGLDHEVIDSDNDSISSTFLDAFKEEEEVNIKIENDA